MSGMLVLGIESASDQCGCALANDDGVVAETRLALPRRHAEALAPQMRFVCEQAGVALGDIDAVAVDQGPGLYTGLRAGLATAKAAAAALGIGVVAVNSLEALAFGSAPPLESGEVVISVLDARRGEVFWAAYQVCASDLEDVIHGRKPKHTGRGKDPFENGFNTRLLCLLLPRVDTLRGMGDLIFDPDGLEMYTAGRLLFVGNGAISSDETRPDGLRYPSPAAVALLGREKALAGAAVAPDAVEPLYLRLPDAQVPNQPGSAAP
ncbi:MAG: tRNA (adenosine(37)-N6)-threonylcarbamoyltransferase complex dimerization subunit type 1 TsaB [Acidimicrobiia bacterium]|nr:tRNA (adenosine(37)-N6)-threonylcarbamoyltransferase complex dimerization subunit type 1 TsaB [Acidimicrobiia bacterium]